MREACVVGAYQGVAASNINGKTLHSLYSLPVSGDWKIGNLSTLKLEELQD